ncbi:uncharacterized protein LOC109402089 isoform X3 [Aedes albopictus]|uniref:Secreted protein n=1 Tax=Aedes albopictus TaxID=7160 RepID=A0ABM1YT70_AEDAL
MRLLRSDGDDDATIRGTTKKLLTVRSTAATSPLLHSTDDVDFAPTVRFISRVDFSLDPDAVHRRSTSIATRNPFSCGSDPCKFLPIRFSLQPFHPSPAAMTLLSISPWKLALVVFLLAASCTQANISSGSSKSSKSSQKPKIAEVGRLIYQQYNDTTWTLQGIYDVARNEFTDTFTTTTQNPLLPTTTPDPSTSTTEKYRISRAELGRILNRNYRGLQKLFRLEWNEAWNQTRYNVAFYKQELNNAIKSRPNATTTTVKP